MRQRRYRKMSAPTQNLDSFLDVLTNTVGALMFISLFMTLVTVEAGTIIKTPLVTQSNKKPHFFEVRNERITYLDAATVDNQLADLRRSLPDCNRPRLPSSLDDFEYQNYLQLLQDYDRCRLLVITQLKNFQGETRHYAVRFLDVNGLLYEPKSATGGESIDELASSDSEFNALLKRFNPQKDYLAFIVRPDSFSAFRAARKQAWKAGFEVGWEPHAIEIPIIFGSEGRAIGVQ